MALNHTSVGLEHVAKGQFAKLRRSRRSPI
jgi:hypothetical protein